MLLESGNSDPDDPVISEIAGASESDMRFWVKKHEDIIPPKGIVNSAQLEREIIRVFANAVMFNPDPERSFGPAFRTRAKVKERHIPTHLADDDHDDDDDANERQKDDENNRQEGEEGAVVRDAREMFEDVERVVAGWRAAEKAAEEAAAAKVKKMVKARSEIDDEADDLAAEASADLGEDKSVKGRAGKRRRT